MELKARGSNKATQSLVFQSHLYGIESRERIVFTLKRLKFQSHLYGIESQDHQAPLGTEERFNRTFMELKVRIHFRMLRNVFYVSIAPLWN